MIKYFLEWALLNTPEAIVLILLCMKSVDTKSKISAIVSSSIIIYVFAEVFGSSVFVQLYMLLGLLFVLSFGYKIRPKHALISIISQFAILAVTQIIPFYIVQNTIGLEEYHNLVVLKRFLILMPSTIVSILIALKVSDTVKELSNMKKVWLFGKTSKRKRG